MIAFPELLAIHAKAAGMVVPKNPDNFHFFAETHPHFYLYCKVQLGRPMPHPSSHAENACLIAALSEAETRTITLEGLTAKGLQ